LLGAGLSQYAEPLRFLVIFDYGGYSVSRQHRWFVLASLLPAFLLVGVFAVVQAQDGKSPAARQARWLV
jgi:hypothetical protein